jgi:DNA-directed RNA polymerase specialized sigma24 family protein
MFTSKHHPNGGAVSHCDNFQLEKAIARFQNGDARSLGEVIRLVEPRAQTLIRFYKTHHYQSESELLSDINFKLLKSITKFDPKRASPFSYVSAVITSTLKTAVSNQRRSWSRYCELDGELANTLPARADDWERADDLIFKIKSQVRTTLTDETELSAQRWFIESFCQDGFASRRHACADACMGVYQLSHARSRELHDLVMLEVRRALFDDRKHREKIVPGRLFGTRCAWMTNYQSLLSAEEFTKFYILMKNLAPYLLLLIVDPAKNGSHRRDRSPTISRKNLELVLNGDPAAVPLFQ